MSTPPSEPTNLVLEELRETRTEMNARFDVLSTRFKGVRLEISDCKCELGGLKFDTFAEIYTANLNFASFADHE